MKRFIYFLTILLLCGSWVMAQTQVTGVVKDKDGIAIGIAVIEKGMPTNGVITDAEGQFKLTLKGASNILVLKGVGYVTKEVAVTGGVMQLTIEQDSKGLGEVVVLGYGRQRKVTVTGAASTITGEEIRQNPSASLQNSLTGKLPGFYSQQRSGRPGADGADFFIRGVSSYNGVNSPLIIVDDIEFTYEQFARLDPNEVESLTILKDASTTAIYGIKGANGVVVVTTVRGKDGPPKISLRTEGSLMQPTRIPEYLGAYETAKLYNQARVNDGLAERFTAEDLELFQNGKDPYGHPDIDWKEVLFKDFSKQLRSNLDVSGGTEKVKYFLSLGYLFQDGMLKHYSREEPVDNDYFHKRYNYRSNLDIAVTKTLTARFDLFGNVGQINTPSVGSPFSYNDLFYDYASFRTLSPFAYNIYNPDGSFGYSKWQLEQGSSYNVNNVVGRMSLYGYQRNFENNMNLVGSAEQKLDFITKGLSLKGTLSYASQHTTSRNVSRDQFASFIYDPANESYTPRDANVFRTRRFFVTYGAGNTIRRLNMQVMLNYDRTFGEAHHVYGLLLFNQNTVLQSNSNADYNYVPSNFRGFTGRLGYDYKDRYLFQFNAGYNGSDLFVASKRYGFFPAVSAGWNISEEPFFDGAKNTVNRLKVRGSYGLVGNDRIGNFNYYYRQSYATGSGAGGAASFGYSHNSFNGVTEGTLPNFEISWEKERKTDIGLELELFKGKIAFNADYFNNNRYDIITNRGGISAIFGQSLPPTNFGKVNNKGYELELIGRGKITKDLSFNVRGIYSFAKNKILEMDEPAPLYPWMRQTGHSIGQIATYQWTGFYQSKEDVAASPTTPVAARPGDLKYADLNNDGVINENDRAYTEYPNLPNTTYGISLGGSFKGLSFNVLFQGSANFNVRSVSEAIQAFSSNLQDIHRYSWTPELGDNARYPLLTIDPGVNAPNNYQSTFWFIRGDFIRLKNAEISYDLPSAWMKKLTLSNARIYANGANLITWSRVDKRYEFDPEITSAIDRTVYPPQRMYNLGISVTF